MGDALLLQVERLPDGRLRVGGHVVAASAMPSLDPRPGLLRLMVRPEAWQLSPASGQGLPGKVLRRAYLGRATEYLVEVPWGELWVLAWGASAPLRAGSPVSLSLRRSGVEVLAFSPAAGTEPALGLRAGGSA